MIKEEWRPIKDYEGLYEVSDLGRVRSLRNKNRILKPSNNPNGYQQVTLSKDNNIQAFLIHRLVANAFLDNKQNLPQVNHIDEIRTNNFVTNLEWVTAKQNLKHSNVCKVMKAAAVKAWEKPVNMYNMYGEFITRFESATKAADFIGGYQQNVSACCYGKIKSYKGYVFRFV